MISDEEIEELIKESFRVFTKRVHCYFLAHQELLENEIYRIAYNFNYNKLLRDLRTDCIPQEQYIDYCKKNLIENPSCYESFKTDFERFISTFTQIKKD